MHRAPQRRKQRLRETCSEQVRFLAKLTLVRYRELVEMGFEIPAVNAVSFVTRPDRIQQGTGGRGAVDSVCAFCRLAPPDVKYPAGKFRPEGPTKLHFGNVDFEDRSSMRDEQ